MEEHLRLAARGLSLDILRQIRNLAWFDSERTEDARHLADYTIELTNDELKLVRNALHSYLDDFGHEEADVLREIKQLLEKLPYHERFFE